MNRQLKRLLWLYIGSALLGCFFAISAMMTACAIADHQIAREAAVEADKPSIEIIP